MNDGRDIFIVVAVDHSINFAVDKNYNKLGSQLLRFAESWKAVEVQMIYEVF